MKKTFLIITALLFITSTAFPQSKVNVNSLKEYGGKAFKVDDDEPYTGRVFDLNKRTGKKTLQGQYKKGLKTGKWSYWDENGRKYKEKDYSNDIDTDIWTYIDKDGSRYKGKSAFRGMGATEAISVIGNIDNATKMYYQTYGEWPTYVEELENSGQLAVDRSTKRKWIFELQLSGQGGRIIATSTGDMDGGEGRVVAFDRESGDYRGYGTTERGTKKNGEFLLWYDDEKTQIKYFKSYKDGKKEGLHIEWHENGQKEKVNGNK